MKKLLAILIAGALVLPATAGIAQDRDRDPPRDSRDRDPPRANGDRDDRARSVHRFKKGERFSRARAANYRRLNYREHRRHLSAPPRGYVWVRAGDDALLVRLSNNLISRVVLDVF